MLRHILKKFSSRHTNCLQLRKIIPVSSFRKDTEDIRIGDWEASSTPEILQKRFVEITGPGNDPKMVINALNSKANCYMLDLEDSMAPSVSNVLKAHENIRQVVRGNLTHETPHKTYTLNDTILPAFMVRVRGLHMEHEGIPATFYDICEFLEHNGRELYESGRGPFIYMPKLESYEDAILVQDVLNECEDYLSLPRGSTKVTALVETFPAIYQVDELIFAMKDRIVGLNCGRWDYLFSMIKSNPDHLFPDRTLQTMDLPFLEAYVREIVTRCHKRGIHAMGGMSAFIPTKDNFNDVVDTVVKDKELEIFHGCDGAWVAHPGLIEPVQQLFEDNLPNDHQKHTIPGLISEQLDDFPLADKCNEQAFRKNISVTLEYISAWINGNGAVAIEGLMEDLATAEISSLQIRNWIDHGVFTLDTFQQILDEECTSPHLFSAKRVLYEYALSDNSFLYEIGKQYVEHPHGFTSLKHDIEVPTPKSGIELTKQRGEFLNAYLYNDKNTAYGFLGTSNGVSAVNVVAGGGGRVGPYAGGWQANAMKNRLGMNLPDTLHVAPEEAASTAHEFNRHLYKAHCIQSLEGATHTDYENIALLADMEQGWNTPEKTRISVQLAIENGINVMHIEDQGDKKRCGHLGDKELNTYEDYAIIMRSANLAAQEMLGPGQNWVRFVARTDAYSAKRIHRSSLLEDPEHPEHRFIDWERGASPDGKYLFLKEGINPDTGKKWGLELSIERGARIVDDGLASHVWMETPDADLQTAKDFLDGVNEILAPKGKQAWGLYNHSPSFDWDVKFQQEGRILARKLLDNIESKMYEYVHSMHDDLFHNNRLFSEQYTNAFVEIIKKVIETHGSRVQGDHLFEKEAIQAMIPHIKDYLGGEEKWNKKQHNATYSSPSGSLENEITKMANKNIEDGFKPEEHITDIIVQQRLAHFSPMLASFGFNMHLITLPEFHVTAFHMHNLSKQFTKTGIEAFVSSTQRPERIKHEQDTTYTYYKHQSATGTGVEAAFSAAVGSANTNVLTDSTESDDIKKRLEF